MWLSEKDFEHLDPKVATMSPPATVNFVMGAADSCEVKRTMDAEWI
jgi:hypothetical protein